MEILAHASSTMHQKLLATHTHLGVRQPSEEQDGGLRQVVVHGRNLVVAAHLVLLEAPAGREKSAELLAHISQKGTCRQTEECQAGCAHTTRRHLQAERKKLSRLRTHHKLQSSRTKPYRMCSPLPPNTPRFLK